MTWRSFGASVYLGSTDIPIGDGAHAQSLGGTPQTRHGHRDSGEDDNQRGLKFLTFQLQFSRTSGSGLAVVNHLVTQPAPQTAGEVAGKKPEVPPSLRSGPENGSQSIALVQCLSGPPEMPFWVFIGQQKDVILVACQ